MKTTRRDFIKMALSAMMALGMPKKAEMEPSECSRIDSAETDLYDQYRAVLDQCECNVDVQVHYGQCEPVEIEWVETDQADCPECQREIIVPASDVEFVPKAEWETLYARDLGKATLTQTEKQQAWLNYVLEEYPGWCKSMGVVNTGYIDATTSVPCAPMDSVTIYDLLDRYTETVKSRSRDVTWVVATSWTPEEDES